MYLAQRLIGVGLYAFTAFLVFVLLPKIKEKNFILNAYIVSLSVMGYYYVPMEGADLTRIYAAVHLYANMSLKEVLKTMVSDGSPTKVLYFHLIGQLHNDNMIPTVTAFITFSFSFFIIKSFDKRTDISAEYVALALLFFMSRGLFMATIANIKSMLALSIIGFSIYKQLYDGDSIIKHVPLMLFGALLHSVGIAALLVFLAYFVIKGGKNRHRFLNFIEALGIIGGGFIYGRSYLTQEVDKGNSYLDSAQSDSGYFYIWEMILSLAVIIVTLLLLRYYYASINIVQSNEEAIVEKSEYAPFMGFMLFFSIIDLIAIFLEFNIGQRLSWLLAILDIPLLLLMFYSCRVSNAEKNRIYKYILVIAVITLLIACARGDLCSLKFSR